MKIIINVTDEQGKLIYFAEHSDFEEAAEDMKARDYEYSAMMEGRSRGSD